ncbi:Probable reductase [Papilio machaon]|uniref:Probable reductase n=1 Tax=Papilio machaon TaxID=76193 RepID=A0A0N0PFG1_PAPMA|nr:Probable reductase [Papilio machaon]
MPPVQMLNCKKPIKVNKHFFQHGRVEPSSNEVELAVQWAIEAGYRHIDTAWAYKIEDQVGRGLANKFPDVPRNEIFVTTKVSDKNVQ